VGRRRSCSLLNCFSTSPRTQSVSVTANSHIPCHSHAVPLPCHDHAVLKAPLKATAQRGKGTARYEWISIGCPETACGGSARFRLLPANTRSSTKVVTRSRLAVRIFPSTTRTFTKDTALSENGRAAAWHVWINAAGERHDMRELAFITTNSSTSARP
jgi:hypothetical protein